MSLIVNDWGYYEKPSEALIQCWNEEDGKMECGVALTGYYRKMTIEQAEALADRIEKLVYKGMELNMQGWRYRYWNTDVKVEFCGGFAVGKRMFEPGIRLVKPNMQMSLRETADLIIQIRNSVEICLGVLKGIARNRSIQINPNVIERVIDTVDKKCIARSKEHARKLDETFGHLVRNGM